MCTLGLFRISACLFAASTLVSAQSLVSYGTAAATGSTAGTVGGAKLNKSIDDIFGKVNKAAEKAAQTGDPVLVKEPPKAKAAASDPGGSSARSTTSHRVAKLADTPAVESPMQTPAAVPEPPPIVATPEMIAGVQSGAKRDDLSKLGSPAYKMSIPEDGHLIEVYRYQTNGKDVGTIRMTDGVVTAVQPPQQ